MDDRPAASIDLHATLASVAEECADTDAVAGSIHELGVPRGPPPRRECRNEGRVCGRRLVFKAVGAVQVAMLVRADRLHRPFPGPNFLVEDPECGRDRMKAEVSADDTVAETGVFEERGSHDRPTRDDDCSG